MKAEIIVPIYGSHITLLYKEDFEYHVPGYDPEELESDDGVTIFHLDQNSYTVCIRPSTFSMSTVTHESVHLAHRIMECVGIPADLLKDEAEAYLTGYIGSMLTSKIYELEDEMWLDLRYNKNFAL